MVSKARERLTISELAERVGKGRQTIRRLEERGILPQPRRDFNNYRYYTEDDVQKILAVLYPEEAPVTEAAS